MNEQDSGFCGCEKKLIGDPCPGFLHIIKECCFCGTGVDESLSFIAKCPDGSIQWYCVGCLMEFYLKSAIASSATRYGF